MIDFENHDLNIINVMVYSRVYLSVLEINVCMPNTYKKITLLSSIILMTYLYSSKIFMYRTYML